MMAHCDPVRRALELGASVLINGSWYESIKLLQNCVGSDPEKREMDDEEIEIREKNRSSAFCANKKRNRRPRMSAHVRDQQRHAL